MNRDWGAPARKSTAHLRNRQAISSRGAYTGLARLKSSRGPHLPRSIMRIRTGFEIVYDCPVPVPMLLMVSVHPSRRHDLETPDWVRTDPALDVRQYLDGYGNICS